MSTERTPRRRGRLATPAWWLAWWTCTVLAGCAGTPVAPRLDPDLAQGPPPSTRAVARELDLHGRRGRLAPAERERLLARVAAQGDGDLVRRHLAVMSAFGDADLSVGNRARLLVDGPATFEAMFTAIEAARHSVLLESYIVEDAAVARRLAALLAKKRADGVTVALLYDAVGSIGTAPEFFDGLRADGVAVCEFNPLAPAPGRGGVWGLSHRDHRKILVVDREIGFTGGINISAVYSSGSFGRRGRAKAPEAGWRDTQIELRGNAAAALEDLLRDTWRHQRCPGELGPPRAGAGAAAGEQLVRIVPSGPSEPYSRLYTLLLAAIDAAQRSVHLTMAYFAPTPEMIEALAEAARRGVDVQLVLPSRSDFRPVLYAGRSHYGRLLEAGVQIHELQDAVLHAKTAVIDGVVSTVGSSNLDWRSFVLNEEVDAVVVGAELGSAMEALFERDVAASRPVTLADWQARPLWRRATEGLARLFERWW
ncbi:phospholipase D-like domain-containing protein [Rubrivivax gelatinosus]|uniref:Cardiolipin synthase n=1 Tax=Rubrivivax gelatinosus (strain NBRC 100245 / IL144) TaxID=983917 RepID=I0HT59_RUBGI|nr:phospholipase D-like domain-containing protein [Rubrivivax gelatinosus]BAL96196.1 cardiolipin synthase [Rubrivivax gelatinosus IL144]